jgi:hypothetical protein
MPGGERGEAQGLLRGGGRAVVGGFDLHGDGDVK